ncbi:MULTISPECIES: NUDIX domain-containing protein [unclassified Paenibacillus]|uniref:NUDIX hydrolase n=1 Tax=unclassified Paenibacillus TaxID=185978 RepID=UPI0024049C11|nr:MULTISPECIES: NUDIX domain-containing protein [unclassified Paenibacillus]MDF9839174.1 8-oxo-dGTP diphosphatase [Paenibacillus sp. PastF-2]MDF9845756.1 8-oxo-dGTP diphosphatase [Paenibacillus sp. PastM-2]MDF9852328.1 8-oxo-dGTP diphosphatase [Paenibacillus sp. PastF-1]MDH6477942.1 8-oxo-dGTP diphosphatase [Paenibacillus sp. PastH-2]MDH6505680.1 8-oxo-dGTP diphosphatase [Paenibacillus sp. PastM-3]
MNKQPITDAQGLTEEQFLQNYDAGVYERPSVTVDMLIFTVMEQEQNNYRKLSEKSLQLLLIKRGQHPYLGQWALPGGFVSINESIEDAARRELYTETNIDNIYMEQLYTWGEVERDPRMRVISCSYMALVDRTTLNVQAGDDAADAAWFEVTHQLVETNRTELEQGYELEKIIRITLHNEQTSLTGTVRHTETVQGHVRKAHSRIIESEGLAFDHLLMVQYAIERLRGKVEYTDIIFNLMPPLFTLSELQRVYEIILGKELLAAAFRRKIADSVTETDEYTKDAGHRPSRLYRYNVNKE